MTSAEYGAAFQQNFERTVASLIAQGAPCDEAREIAQAAWVKGWERISQLRKGRLVVQWVNAIARSLLITSFRRPQFVDLPHLIYEPGIPPSVNVAEIDMRRGIERCKPHERRSLEAYLEGYSNNELAVQTGKSPAAVDAEAYRARGALREQMHVPRRQVLPDIGLSRKKAQPEDTARMSEDLGAPHRFPKECEAMSTPRER